MSSDREIIELTSCRKALLDANEGNYIVVDDLLVLVRNFVTYYEKAFEQRSFPYGRPVDSGFSYMEIRDNKTLGLLQSVDVFLSSTPTATVHVVQLQNFDVAGSDENQESIYHMESFVMNALLKLYGSETRIVASSDFDCSGVVGQDAQRYLMKRFGLQFDKSVRGVVIQYGGYYEKEVAKVNFIT